MTAGIDTVGDSLDIGLDAIPPYALAAEDISFAASSREGDDDDNDDEAAAEQSVMIPKHTLHFGCPEEATITYVASRSQLEQT